MLSGKKSLVISPRDGLKRLAKTLWRETLFVRSFGLVKVPLIFYVAPKVLELSQKRIEIKIPLNWRTKNHFGAMYFGAQAIGADLAAGALAMDIIRKEKLKVSLAFKDFNAQFLKRAEADTHFICEQGDVICQQIKVVAAQNERINFPVHVVAKVPTLLGDEVVSQFTLTMSLKKKV
jgi:acyl-coenzyme A thioesterase PaaI-like protein